MVEPFHHDEAPFRFGREDFSPDFVIRTSMATDGKEQWLVEVKYRSSVDQFVCAGS